MLRDLTLLVVRMIPKLSYVLYLLAMLLLVFCVIGVQVLSLLATLVQQYKY